MKPATWIAPAPPKQEPRGRKVVKLNMAAPVGDAARSEREHQRKGQIVTLPWPSQDLSPNARGHWSKKAKAAKSYRADCNYLTKMAKVCIDWEGAIQLHLEFCPPDARHRDWDNLLSSLKSGIDGIADALQVNDRIFRFHLLSGEQVKGGAVRVRIGM